MPCSAGQFSNDGAIGCTLCPAGFAHSSSGQPSCPACAALDGDPSTNTYQTEAGEQSCITCDVCSVPEEFRVGCLGAIGGGMCTTCVPGSYKTGSGSQSTCLNCTSCGEGFCNPDCGQLEQGACIACDVGFYKMRGIGTDGRKCNLNQVGTLRNATCDPCQPCLPGSVRQWCGGASRGNCSTVCAAGLCVSSAGESVTVTGADASSRARWRALRAAARSIVCVSNKTRRGVSVGTCCCSNCRKVQIAGLGWRLGRSLPGLRSGAVRRKLQQLHL